MLSKSGGGQRGREGVGSCPSMSHQICDNSQSPASKQLQLTLSRADISKSLLVKPYTITDCEENKCYYCLTPIKL